MILFDERTGYLTAKDLGRLASNFYVKSTSIEVFNEMMRPRMTEADVFSMLSMGSEFDNIKVREEESKELLALQEDACICAVKVILLLNVIDIVFLRGRSIIILVF